MAGTQHLLSRETWETICLTWQIFPVVATLQHLLPTAASATPTTPQPLPSKLQLYALSTATSLPSAILILYLTFTSPTSPLPIGNYTMATLYAVHALYRAFLSPSPSILALNLHPAVPPTGEILASLAAQILCGLSLGGWLAGYGKSTVQEWAGLLYLVEIGLVVWGWGLLAMVLHEDELKPWAERYGCVVLGEGTEPEGTESKGTELKRPEKEEDENQKSTPLPRNYLFKYILYPHYLFSLISCLGFWMIGGWACEPARVALVYEFSITVAKALRGRRRMMGTEGGFERGEVEGRWVLVPGIF